MNDDVLTVPWLLEQVLRLLELYAPTVDFKVRSNANHRTGRIFYVLNGAEHTAILTLRNGIDIPLAWGHWGTNPWSTLYSALYALESGAVEGVF